MTRMSLIVTGSIGIDTIDAPTGKAEDVLGGSAIYFAAAASFFGDVRLVAAVGDDFPDRHLDTFRHFNVNLDGLERRRNSRTFRWHGRYRDDMNQRDTLAVELNVLAEALPPVPQHYRDSRYVFLANTHPAGQIALLEHFPKAELVVADTMDLWIDNERETLLDLLRRVDGLVLNYEESFQLTGKSNAVVAAEAIHEMGPTFVVIKKGEHGSLLSYRGDDGHGLAALPAFAARDVVDPTGAGDTFAGGMLGYLAGEAGGEISLRSLRKAMALGTVVASYTIESFSLDRLKQITRGDLDGRLRSFCEMLTVD
jgi:sugar/nucleoside kinase (ribokinase family)